MSIKNKSILKIAGMGLAVALITGCSIKPVIDTSDLKGYESEASFAKSKSYSMNNKNVELPEWVVSGTYTQSEKDQFMSGERYFVGISTPNADRVTAFDEALIHAKSQIIGEMGTNIYSEISNSVEVSNSIVKRDVKQRVDSFIFGTVSGVQEVERYTHPVTGEFYILVKIAEQDMKEVKNNYKRLLDAIERNNEMIEVSAEQTGVESFDRDLDKPEGLRKYEAQYKSELKARLKAQSEIIKMIENSDIKSESDYMLKDVSGDKDVKLLNETVNIKTTGILRNVTEVPESRKVIIDNGDKTVSTTLKLKVKVKRYQLEGFDTPYENLITKHSNYSNSRLDELRNL